LTPGAGMALSFLRRRCRVAKDWDVLDPSLIDADRLIRSAYALRLSYGELHTDVDLRHVVHDAEQQLRIIDNAFDKMVRPVIAALQHAEEMRDYVPKPRLRLHERAGWKKRRSPKRGLWV
jgi:hypothetical protein